MQSFMITMLICSVTMSAFALFYMAITPLLAKRYSVKGRYYAWLVIVIGLIIPFRPQFNNAIVKVDMPGETAAPIIQIGNGTPVTIPDVNTVLPPAMPSISWWQVVAVVWLIGMIVFLAYHAIKHYDFVKMARRWSESITDDQSLSILQSLKTEMGISKQINLYLCSSVGSPMMIGFVNPRILLPTADLAYDELRFILKHEIVHYKRKDLYYKCLVLIATAIHWYNPIIYLMAKAIDVLCEISCDAEIIRSSDADTRQHYSETIIGVVKYHSKLKTALSTNFYGGKKGMKKRIFSIMDSGKKKTGAAIICAALIVTLGTGFAFAASANGNTSDNTPSTNYSMFSEDENMPSAPVEQKPAPEYTNFGISYNGKGEMLFNDKLVRYFWDGYNLVEGTATHYEYLNENGVVDVHTERSVIENGDGSVNPFGELKNIVAYSQLEFEQRDIEFIKNGALSATTTLIDENASDNNGIFSEASQEPSTNGGIYANTTTLIDENGGNQDGKTIAEIFADYKDFGIEYVEVNGLGGMGNVLYKGQAVEKFIDERPNGGVFTYQSIDGGEIVVRTVYDTSGKILGVELVSN